MVKVSVIGCGNLGVKIAGELAYHGHEVRIYDRCPETLNRAHLRIKEDKRLLHEDGILANQDFTGEIFFLTRLEDAVKCSDFIFEATPDDLSLKQELFEWITRSCRQDAIVATNSLHLNCDDVFSRAVYKERCLGMRFLYPVYCIPEVEITPGQETSNAVLEKARQFLARMGKIAFLRSGPDPVVLSEEQRELKRLNFLRNLQQNARSLQKLKFRVPDLANKEVVCKGIHLDSEETLSHERDCVVCMDEERNCVLHPCHHLCTCCTCGRMLLKRQEACPICRKDITSVFRVFHS